jgi:hypothetical protein
MKVALGGITIVDAPEDKFSFIGVAFNMSNNLVSWITSNNMSLSVCDNKIDMFPSAYDVAEFILNAGLDNRLMNISMGINEPVLFTDEGLFVILGDLIIKLKGTDTSITWRRENVPPEFCELQKTFNRIMRLKVWW